MLAGCGGDVQVYKVVKEKETAATDPHAGHDHGPGEGHGSSLSWKAPTGWTEKAPSQFRAAAFDIAGEPGKSAEVTVIPLPGLAGGDLGNVNRWRSQVGLAPITEDELRQSAEAVKVDGQEGQIYEMAGRTPGADDEVRILGAIVRKEGVAWFFKMTGADDLVKNQKPAFRSFLESFTFGSGAPAAAAGRGPMMGGGMGGGASSALPADHPPIGGGGMSAADAGLPADHPPIPGVGAGAGAAGGGMMAAAAPAEPLSGPGKMGSAPAGWKEVAGGQFLFAKYLIDGAEGQTAVNVSTSAGEGGGVAGNINRWRNQLGQANVTAEEIAKLTSEITVPGGKAILVDLSGSDPKTGAKSKILGAIVPKGSATWFFKMMGPESTVTRERETFLKFVQNAQYPDAR